MNLPTTTLRSLCLCFVASMQLVPQSGEVRAHGWQAGVAAVKITPEKAIWMSGSSSRTKPAEGAVHELWAKALAVEDPTGYRAVLVTLDLCGIDRKTSVAVRRELEKEFGLEPSQVILNCSHTHGGPVVGRNLSAMYFLDEEAWRRIDGMS